MKNFTGIRVAKVYCVVYGNPEDVTYLPEYIDQNLIFGAFGIHLCSFQNSIVEDIITQIFQKQNINYKEIFDSAFCPFINEAQEESIIIFKKDNSSYIINNTDIPSWHFGPKYTTSPMILELGNKTVIGLYTDENYLVKEIQDDKTEKTTTFSHADDSRNLIEQILQKESLDYQQKYSLYL